MAVAGIALDLWTKHWAFTRLDPDPMKGYDIITGFLSFRRTLNDGALFGLGKGLWFVFILASVLALGFVWYLFSNSTRDRRSLHIGLALILAGAIGNLYDRSFEKADVIRSDRGREVGRLVGEDDRFLHLAPYPDTQPVRRIARTKDVTVHRQGVVRDFIKIEIKRTIEGKNGKINIELWPWVFNIADVFLVVGVGLLLLNFWWERRAAREAASPPPDEIIPSA